MTSHSRSSVNPAECEQCVEHLSHSLIGACASVGIEHGMTTLEVLGVHMHDYHERGHR